MTLLHKPLKRVTNEKLGSGHGSDGRRRIVVTLLPGNGDDVPDMIELRPERTRRGKLVAIRDVYTYILKCEANKATIDRMNKAKAKKAAARELRRFRRSIRENS